MSTFTIAGCLHFLTPNLFLVAMPPYIPFHEEVIFLTGVIEIIFVAGLFFKEIRGKVFLAISIYLLLLLPAHLHVSLNKIEMFGIDSPLLLWGRTILQFPFAFWAYQLSKESA